MDNEPTEDLKTLAARVLKAAQDKGVMLATAESCTGGLISAALVTFTLVITDFGIPKVIGGNFNVLATEVFKLVIGQQDFQRPRVMSDGNLKGPGHRIGCNVIMGRANAARGEHIGVARPQGIQRGNNIALVIGNTARFPEVNAQAHEIVGNEAQILVLGAPGQDFIANQQYGCGRNRCHDYLGQWLDICHRFSPLSKP